MQDSDVKYSIQCIFGDICSLSPLSTMVYGALDAENKTCILKVSGLGKEKELQWEYQVLKTLNSLEVPRVPRLVHELGRDEANRLVLVTTPVGTSLRNSRFEQEMLDRLVLEIGSTLSTMHGHGWVHGDISPGNIIWTGKEFRLIDFGFAQKIQEHINSGVRGLTPAFCSARVQVGFPASFDDDWESFLYVFVFLNIRSLPWMAEQDEHSISKKKLSFLKELDQKPPEYLQRHGMLTSKIKGFIRGAESIVNVNGLGALFQFA
jgi:serine/threonine protein kinase